MKNNDKFPNWQTRRLCAYSTLKYCDFVLLLFLLQNNNNNNKKKKIYFNIMNVKKASSVVYEIDN